MVAPFEQGQATQLPQSSSALICEGLLAWPGWTLKVSSHSTQRPHRFPLYRMHSRCSSVPLPRGWYPCLTLPEAQWASLPLFTYSSLSTPMQSESHVPTNPDFYIMSYLVGVLVYWEGDQKLLCMYLWGVIPHSSWDHWNYFNKPLKRPQGPKLQICVHVYSYTVLRISSLLFCVFCCSV